MCERLDYPSALVDIRFQDELSPLGRRAMIIARRTRGPSTEYRHAIVFTPFNEPASVFLLALAAACTELAASLPK